MALTRTTSSLLLSRSRGSFNRLVFESEHSIGGGSSDRSIFFCSLLQFFFTILKSYFDFYSSIKSIRKSTAEIKKKRKKKRLMMNEKDEEDKEEKNTIGAHRKESSRI